MAAYIAGRLKVSNGIGVIFSLSAWDWGWWGYRSRVGRFSGAPAVHYGRNVPDLVARAAGHGREISLRWAEEGGITCHKAGPAQARAIVPHMRSDLLFTHGRCG